MVANTTQPQASSALQTEKNPTTARPFLLFWKNSLTRFICSRLSVISSCQQIYVGGADNMKAPLF